ncbi:hypothetical protein L596_015826 [Steinernema carpocapsae]|uniref:Uncharacterized protein n=1 Tax=Steinernema carpocapsae TaxID=34508 RepID=A0A4U5NG47_STECR|nr:hypothetical protein L596_015826 [Steinernema carpocapsae]
MCVIASFRFVAFLGFVVSSVVTSESGYFLTIARNQLPRSYVRNFKEANFAVFVITGRSVSDSIGPFSDLLQSIHITLSTLRVVVMWAKRLKPSIALNFLSHPD